MLKHTHTVYLGGGYRSPAETYKLYTCTYCGQLTRYPDGHTCRRPEPLNLSPRAFTEPILDDGDHPAGRAGEPQVTHWTTPPYTEHRDVCEDTPEEEAMKKAAIDLYESPYPSTSKERDLIEAAMDYAATQAPYYDEGETQQ